MKKFKKENYQVGRFVIPGKESQSKSHVVEVLTYKPLCRCEVNNKAIFNWTSFHVKDAQCKVCQAVIKGLKKKAWKKR